MDNIINFPTTEVRHWAAWTQFVHHIVSQAGHPPGAADHILAQARPLFDLLMANVYRASIETTEDCMVAINSLTEQFEAAREEQTRQIMTERLLRECALYAAHGYI